MSATPSAKVAGCGPGGGASASMRAAEVFGEAGERAEVEPVTDHPLVRGREETDRRR